MASDNDARKPLLEQELTGKIIAAFFETYNVLGYGFLESVYRKALAIELRLRGLRVEEEVRIDVFYKGYCVGWFKLDLLVEVRVGVELKATELLGPTDKRQLMNYLTSSTID